MSAKIPLKIVTPEGVFVEEDVESFLVPSTQGPLEVGPGYTNLITTILPAGVMWIRHKNKKDYYAVFGGVLRIDGQTATLYTQEINDGYEIDMARAIAARDRSLDLISSSSDGDDVRLARIRLDKSLARISAKSLSEGKNQ